MEISDYFSLQRKEIITDISGNLFILIKYYDLDGNYIYSEIKVYNPKEDENKLLFRNKNVCYSISR